MSTLSQLMDYVDLNGLPIQYIFYGFNDTINVLDQPFAALDDFKQTPEYNTAGVVFRKSTFRFHVFANTLQKAEELALAVDAQWNLSAPCGDASRLLQQSYEVVQEQLYIFHVVIHYELFEG